MSAHQNQRQRLQDVGEAFIVLASGRMLKRKEIFDGAQESWHAAFMARLMKEELIIKHPAVNPAETCYQAVDEGWFSRLAENPVGLAEWYFKRGVIPTVAESEPEPVAPPPDLTLPATPAARRLPTPVQQVTFEAPPPEPEPEQEQAPQGNVGDEILKTLIMVAENIVYLRQRLETIEAKVDEVLRIDSEVDKILRRG